MNPEDQNKLDTYLLANRPEPDSAKPDELEKITKSLQLRRKRNLFLIWAVTPLSAALLFVVFSLPIFHQSNHFDGPFTPQEYAELENMFLEPLPVDDEFFDPAWIRLADSP